MKARRSSRRADLAPRHALGLLLACVALALGPPARVSAQALDANLWVTDGDVRVVAPWGNTLYVGGDFTYVGPNTGGLVELNDLGRATVRMPRVDGEVVTRVSDGAGGWFIGGAFGRVAGLERPGLAHILADGSVSAWAADPTPLGSVTALERAGTRLFVATTASFLGAYDTETGAEILGWQPEISGLVEAMAVHGTTLFAGGQLSFVIPDPLFSGSGIAAIHTQTGEVEAWDPAPDGGITRLQIEGRWLYVSGGFGSIGGQDHGCLARALLSTKEFDSGWNADVDSPVRALAAVNDRLWIGGGFFLVAGEFRDRIAVLDTTTGAAVGTPLDLSTVNGEVTALAHRAQYVFLGLSPFDIGPAARSAKPMVLRVHAASGALDDGWRSLGEGLPLTNVRAVSGLVPTPTGLIATGSFHSLGGRPQVALAAFDLASGLPRAWDPLIASTEAFPGIASVSAIVPTSHGIYVGGHFTHAGGQARSSLAALDSAAARVQPWKADLGSASPGIVGSAHALALHQGKLIVGGDFTTLAGTSRASLAQVDTSGSTPVLGWSCDVTGVVRCLLVRGDTVFVGGSFTAVDAQALGHVAAVNAATGDVVAWNAAVQGIAVYALAARSDTLYVGGDYSHVGGQSRPCLAAVSTATGALRAWDPAAFGPVRALLVDGPGLFVGGEFEMIAGLIEPHFARLSRFTNGHLLGAWSTDDDVLALADGGGGGAVYAGGSFSGFALSPTAHLARAGGMESVGPAVNLVAANGGEWLVPGTVFRFEYTASDPSGVESVDLELSRSGPGGPWTLLAAGLRNTGSHAWDVSGPEAPGTAYVRVTARDFAGNLASDVSDLAFTIGAAVLSVGPGAGGPLAGSLVLGPNPAHDRAMLRFALRQPLRARLRLMDVQGREVGGSPERSYAAGEQVVPVELRAIPAGLYFLRFESGRTARTVRLAVIR
jgi:hypothetical protein